MNMKHFMKISLFYLNYSFSEHSDFVINSKFEKDNEQVMYAIHNISYSVPNYHSTQRLLNGWYIKLKIFLNNTSCI